MTIAKTITITNNKLIKILFSTKNNKLFKESLKAITKKEIMAMKAKVMAEIDFAFLYPYLK